MDADVIVVGAGPAGLAVAACLQKRGVPALVLDRGASAGESWRRRYDRLHLHTPRSQSAMPGLGIPARYGRWVAKDDMARYIDLYARHHGIAPLFGSEARRLERDGDGWVVVSKDKRWTAPQVVLATGYSHSPVLPAWPGAESFEGELIHAGQYTSPAAYAGRDVLV